MADFALDVRRWAEAAKALPSRVQKEAASEVARRLSDRTHVLTGRLVGNWKASHGTPAIGGDEPPDPSRNRAVARNLGVIQAAPAGAPIFIANGTPYILFEEFGTSRRAPHPVFRGIAAELPEIARVAAAKVAGRG